MQRIIQIEKPFPEGLVFFGTLAVVFSDNQITGNDNPSRRKKGQQKCLSCRKGRLISVQRQAKLNHKSRRKRYDKTLLCPIGQIEKHRKQHRFESPIAENGTAEQHSYSKDFQYLVFEFIHHQQNDKTK